MLLNPLTATWRANWNYAEPSVSCVNLWRKWCKLTTGTWKRDELEEEEKLYGIVYNNAKHNTHTHTSSLHLHYADLSKKQAAIRPFNSPWTQPEPEMNSQSKTNNPCSNICNALTHWFYSPLSWHFHFVSNNTDTSTAIKMPFSRCHMHCKPIIVCCGGTCLKTGSQFNDLKKKNNNIWTKRNAISAMWNYSSYLSGFPLEEHGSNTLQSLVLKLFDLLHPWFCSEHSAEDEGALRHTSWKHSVK